MHLFPQWKASVDPGLGKRRSVKRHWIALKIQGFRYIMECEDLDFNRISLTMVSCMWISCVYGKKGKVIKKTQK